MSEETTCAFIDVMTIGVPVIDQDRALAFYVDTLGFEKRLDVPLEQFGGRWIIVAPPDARTTIALVPAGDDNPAGIETGIRLTTADAAALHTRLQSRDVTVGELLLWDGVPPMFTFRDQDGNGFEAVEQPTLGSA